MTLTENVKEEARKASFKAVGISNLDGLRDLHYGKTDYVGVLKMPVRACVFLNLAKNGFYSSLSFESSLNF